MRLCYNNNCQLIQRMVVVFMDKKTIQKRRTMRYFIDAAYQIIEEKGIDNITIRDVADIAGYNSATLYNYFENLDHLIFFTSLKYLKNYVQDLNNYTKDSKNALDKFIKIWECFCKHSLSNPKIYYNIFFGKYSNSLNNDIKEYYSIFPEELGEQQEDIMVMLLGQNMYERNLAILKSCANEGFIKKENIVDINEMVVSIYQGMISRILNNGNDYDVEDLKDKIMKYIKQVIISFEGNIFAD